MMFFSRRRTSSLIAPYLFGVGCMAIGAGIAVLFTPTTGVQLRSRILNLFRRGPSNAQIDDALDQMTSERGIGQNSSRGLDQHV